MAEKKDPTAFVDGYRVVQPYNPRPLTPLEALTEGKRQRQRAFSVLGVLAIVAVLLLFAGVVGSLTGGEPKTFASFLDMLQSAPVISTAWLDYLQISLELPSWLDWLLPFINFVNGFFSVIGFLVTGAIQAIGFVLHFLQWVFI